MPHSFYGVYSYIYIMKIRFKAASNTHLIHKNISTSNLQQIKKRYIVNGLFNVSNTGYSAIAAFIDLNFFISFFD